LKWDTWNDYGFETTFEVRVHWPDRKPIELGIVKILRGDQTGGRTPLKSQFVRLNEDHCSLGQDIAYYEMLHKLGPWGRAYLQHMRDVVGSPIILESFETHKGFKDSLLRSSGAEIALADAPNLFSSVHNESQSIDIDHLAFAIETAVGGNTFLFSVDLARNELNERCAVLIGYNAVGKTKLLGNIGMVASRKKDDPDELRIRRKFGEFLGKAPNFPEFLLSHIQRSTHLKSPRPHPMCRRNPISAPTKRLKDSEVTYIVACEKWVTAPSNSKLRKT
jgi:hypothetical protein